MRNSENSRQPNELEQRALELRQQLHNDPYLYSNFRAYIEQVDGGYLQDLEKFLADHTSVDLETFNVLNANYKSFLAQTNANPLDAKVMGRSVHPDVLAQQRQSWEEALASWNSRHAT